MNNFCGIDFGTSNSTLGIIQNNQNLLVNLEHNHQTIPSAIFYEFDENEVVFGRKALDYYKHRYSGRLIRSFKSVLGTNLMNETTQIKFDKVSFITIIETFLQHMKNTAEKQHNVSLDSVVLGRPIHFIDNNEERDRQAEETLRQAAKNIGFKHVEMQFEPIAASLKYEQSLRSEQLVLIVDIGGGTSDISVIRLSPERSKLMDRTSDCLANAGIHIGGTDFDKSLNFSNVMPLLGYNQERIDGLMMPNHLYMDIAIWHRINNIYKREFILNVKSLKGRLKDSKQYDRLYSVVEKKLAFSIALLVEQAKVSLSNVDTLKYDFSFIEDGLAINFSKQDLKESIMNQLLQIGDTIDNCINIAGIKKSDIDSVFLTGGSSQMSIIKEFISQHMSGTKVDNQDSLSSVGTGLVIDASRKFR